MRTFRRILAALVMLVVTYGGLPPLTFEVLANSPPQGYHTLTLSSRHGGDVAIGSGSFGETRTAHFAPGTRITIRARSDRDYFFDRWSYSWGSTTHGHRPETTFIMPNRDVTVTAFFEFDRWDWWYRDRDWWWYEDRDWRRNDGRHWWQLTDPLTDTETTSGMPDNPRPAGGIVQVNDPATGAAHFTIDMPGVLNGQHFIGVSGLPDGLTAPSLARVYNNELHLIIPGISAAAQGTYTLLVALFDSEGRQTTIPILLTLVI